MNIEIVNSGEVPVNPDLANALALALAADLRTQTPPLSPAPQQVVTVYLVSVLINEKKIDSTFLKHKEQVQLIQDDDVGEGGHGGNDGEGGGGGDGDNGGDEGDGGNGEGDLP